MTLPAGVPLANCLEFIRWVIQEGPWEGCDLDGGVVQDEAERLGLIVSVPYDPEKHGNNNCDPGDPWFEFAPILATLEGYVVVPLGLLNTLLSDQQALCEGILDLAKRAALPADQINDFEKQCQKSAVAIAAVVEGEA